MVFYSNRITYIYIYCNTYFVISLKLFRYEIRLIYDLCLNMNNAIEFKPTGT